MVPFWLSSLRTEGGERTPENVQRSTSNIQRPSQRAATFAKPFAYARFGVTRRRAKAAFAELPTLTLWRGTDYGEPGRIEDRKTSNAESVRPPRRAG